MEKYIVDIDLSGNTPQDNNAVNYQKQVPLTHEAKVWLNMVLASERHEEVSSDTGKEVNS